MGGGIKKIVRGKNRKCGLDLKFGERDDRRNLEEIKGDCIGGNGKERSWMEKERNRS